jgi:Uma2 family endonuclease
MSNPTSALQEAEEHQARWQQVVRDPSLQDLSYKVETNQRGQILLSPHGTRHAKLQKRLIALLDDQLSGGEAYPEFPLATDAGVKVPDVVWVSTDREARMMKTGDPSTLAPEICVEVLSEANTEAEMQEKRQLYREAGAGEVWLVADDGSVRFFADERLDRSMIAPDFPERVEV